MAVMNATQTPAADPNEKFLIADFKVPGEDGEFRRRVYLLNPGDHFDRFGGSSSGLLVRKTASLITRDDGPWGRNDYETDIHSKATWAAIFTAHAASLK